MDKFVIHNTSKIKAEIHFCFQHDTKATTFLLDPPNMTLEPNERKVCKFIYLIFCRVYFWDCLSWKPFFVVKNMNLAVFAPNSLTSHFLILLTTFVVNYAVPYEDQLVEMLQ